MDRVVIIPKTNENPEMRYVNSNYTDLPEFEGWHVIYIGSSEELEHFTKEPTRFEGIKKVKDGWLVPRSEIAIQLARSFEAGLHDQGQKNSLSIDLSHGAGQGKNDKSIGRVLAVKTINAEHLNYGISEMPVGSMAVMGKLAWYSKEIENIYNDEYGKKVSVFFLSDGTLMNLAICQLPAVLGVPSVKVKTFETDCEKFEMTLGLEIGKEKSMEEEVKDEKTKRDFTDARLAHKAKTNDPDITQELYMALKEGGLPDADIDVVGGVTDESARILIDLIKGGTPTEGTGEEESLAESAEEDRKDDPEKLQKSIVKAVIDEIKPLLATEPKAKKQDPKEAETIEKTTEEEKKQKSYIGYITEQTEKGMNYNTAVINADKKFGGE